MRARRLAIAIACLACVAVSARPAAAQIIPGWIQNSFQAERIDEDNVRLTKEVEIEGEAGSPNAGQKFFADGLEFNLKTGELTARGNVVFQTPTAQISAESVVFNTKTGQGTFHTASGISQLGERGNRALSMFGGLEPDVYFYGEKIEKIGDKKYKITKGGFSTCVQPTPRWEIIGNTATVSLDDYVFLKNAVVTVKNVPVFYLPAIYYPIQDDNRSTGILMPMYGASTYRGQSISNAFFWAINRSQDATLFDDWFFTTNSNGVGGEYRYIIAPESSGNFKMYWLNESEREINGQIQPAKKSQQMTGGLTQKLPFHMTGRARVDYFTDVTVQQLYNHNLYDATRSTRTITAGASGAWRGLSTNANFSRTEIFNTPTDSIVNGTAPLVTMAYSSPQLVIPLFATVNAEATRYTYLTKSATGVQDLGLTKMDLFPTLRSPLSKLPYLQATATFAYRTTYFSESVTPDRKTQIEEPVTRNYADMSANIIGPVFSKVYQPNNAFAGRLKHVIEPSWTLQHKTEIKNQNLIPNVGGGSDTIIGGSTSFTYGLANRVLVRKVGGAQNDPASAPREFLNVSLRQTYYSNDLASKFDTSYAYGYLNRANNPFSSVSLVARALPTMVSAVDFRLEYDPVKEATQRLLGFGLNGTYRTPAVSATGGWSRRPQPGSPGTNYLQSQVDMRFKNSTYGGTVIYNYDIANSTLINQRYVGFYNAQCCGVSFEWQAFNYPSTSNFPIKQDRRFSMSFTLAGVGSFSNFLGAFGVGTQ